jgi:hypothetical protein
MILDIYIGVARKVIGRVTALGERLDLPHPCIILKKALHLTIGV